MNKLTARGVGVDERKFFQAHAWHVQPWLPWIRSEEQLAGGRSCQLESSLSQDNSTNNCWRLIGKEGQDLHFIQWDSLLNPFLPQVARADWAWGLRNCESVGLICCAGGGLKSIPKTEYYPPSFGRVEEEKKASFGVSSKSVTYSVWSVKFMQNVSNGGIHRSESL